MDNAQIFWFELTANTMAFINNANFKKGYYVV